MRITVVKTGGIAGVRERLGPVDTSSIDPDRAREIESKVDAAGFFDLPPDLPREREIRDGFNYRVNVSAGSNEHSVSFGDGSEGSAAKQLRELIALLEDAGASFEGEDRNG